MTKNETTKDITEKLQKLNTKDINIQINYELGTSVNFLDVTVHNDNGKLRTSLHHKEAAEPYILPFTSDHPSHIHRNIPYAALLRAARICSHLNDFNSERIRIQVSLLLNEYPPRFIEKMFIRFFRMNNIELGSNRFNQDRYHLLHDRLLNQPTRREKVLLVPLQNAITAPQVLQPKIWDKTVMFPRYLHALHISQDITKHLHNWWREHYGAIIPRCENIRVRLIATTDRTLETQLIKKKPSKNLLRGIEDNPSSPMSN